MTQEQYALYEKEHPELIKHVDYIMRELKQLSIENGKTLEENASAFLAAFNKKYS